MIQKPYQNLLESSQGTVSEPDIPKLSELGLDLLDITPAQRVVTLATPFLCVTLYALFASTGYWLLALFTLMYLSFCTYGSISHDLVHRTLGLSKRTNELFLFLIELFAIRSGHAYRFIHLYHHKRFPHDDDIEGAAAKMTLFESLVDGTTLQFRIYYRALTQSTNERGWIVLEGIGPLCIIVASVVLAPITIVPLVYVALMIMGSWIIPFITSYLPHNPAGQGPLYQTRLFRGKVASVIALEHLYHLEHHLYPGVPHHHWPSLAKRLDPYFEAKGIKPNIIWF